MMPDKMRITQDELFSPKVDDIVAEQEALRRPLGDLGPTSLWRRIVFNSLFFLSVAGLIGGIAGWGIMEPHIQETFDVWGEIEYVKENELPGLGGRAGATIISVRGIQFYVIDKYTLVEGRGPHAGIDGAAKLKAGLPVRVRAMRLDLPGEATLAERVSARPIPPGRDKDPLPEMDRSLGVQLLVAFSAFAVVGACIAGCVAAADGLMSRNLRRGLLCGIAGIGIAAAGGLVASLPANMIHRLGLNLAFRTTGESGLVRGMPTGFSLVVMIVGRSLAWGIVGLTLGLGQGVALRSKKLIVNGLLGGLLGALLGGMFFDPLYLLFRDSELSAGAAISRMFGFGTIGVAAGCMIGLVEHLSKDAWLLMRAGPLAGKQFVIYKSPTTLGSSPKCEIYLFKDPDVEPRHALIRKVGSRHEIEDLSTPAGTVVNGKKAKRQPLKDGDQIILGQTVLEYAERAHGAS